MTETIYLLRLQGHFVHSQLEIEEALLRADDRNWCILNQGSAPAIVMGISGKPEKLIDQEHWRKNSIPLIRRFSGGGTVVIDEDTFLSTFIFNHKSLPVPLQPESIMSWSESFYRPIFSHPEFKLRENDFVIGEKKFGGNAQYLRRDRWLHHTSFLWDYTPSLMNTLQLPEKRPSYRQNRHHSDFLCTLKDHFSSREVLIDRILQHLHGKFHVVESSLSDLSDIFMKDYRKSTTLLNTPLQDTEPTEINMKGAIMGLHS